MRNTTARVSKSPCPAPSSSTHSKGGPGLTDSVQDTIPKEIQSPPLKSKSRVASSSLQITSEARVCERHFHLYSVLSATMHGWTLTGNLKGDRCYWLGCMWVTDFSWD